MLKGEVMGIRDEPSGPVSYLVGYFDRDYGRSALYAGRTSSSTRRPCPRGSPSPGRGTPRSRAGPRRLRRPDDGERDGHRRLQRDRGHLDGQPRRPALDAGPGRRRRGVGRGPARRLHAPRQPLRGRLRLLPRPGRLRRRALRRTSSTSRTACQRQHRPGRRGGAAAASSSVGGGRSSRRSSRRSSGVAHGQPHQRALRLRRGRLLRRRRHRQLEDARARRTARSPATSSSRRRAAAASCWGWATGAAAASTCRTAPDDPRLHRSSRTRSTACRAPTTSASRTWRERSRRRSATPTPWRT